MVQIREVIIVEGKYDKNTVSQVVDTVIIETSGFQVFRSKEKMQLIRRLAEARGIIVLTDSDSAGFLIRNHIKGTIPKEQMKHAYIPDLSGKERRKREWSKEGLLGVEGMSPEIILQALRRAGATFVNDGKEAELVEKPLRMADLFEAGLAGTPGSSQKRKTLLHFLQLPERMSSNALLDVMNALYSREEFNQLLMELQIQA